MKNIYLVIEYKGELVTIPFTGLKKCDAFTSKFTSHKELLEFLINELSLPFNIYDVTDMYLYHPSEEAKVHEPRYLPIKYKVDIFDNEDLKKKYIEYLAADTTRIKNSKLQSFNSANIPLTKDEISKMVANYLSEKSKDKTYRKREVYFKLKQMGYQVLPKEENIARLNSDLSNILATLANKLELPLDDDNIKDTFDRALALTILEDAIGINLDRLKKHINESVNRIGKKRN